MRLEEFLGNERLVRLLSGKPLPPASLFAGPEGVGKKTLALCLATRVCCLQPRSGEACGRCSACQQAASGSHPDIRLLKPEKGQIRIAATRELSLEIQFRPFSAPQRFFLIDEADRMNEAAANSLLKTLEEPPDCARIVLVSSRPQLLLPTIRSRCQPFNFRPLNREEVAAFLAGRVAGEEIPLRAAFARGSIGRALALDLQKTLAERDRMLDILSHWLQSRSFAGIFERCEKDPLRSDLKDRDRVAGLLELLEILGQDLYFCLAGTPERLVSLDRRESLERLAQRTTLDWLRDFLYHIERARWETEHFVNPLMCFETLWLGLRDERSHAGTGHGQV